MTAIPNASILRGHRHSQILTFAYTAVADEGGLTTAVRIQRLRMTHTYRRKVQCTLEDRAATVVIAALDARRNWLVVRARSTDE